MHTYVHICTHMHTHAHICTHMHTYAHICTHMYPYAHICTHMYPYAHICTHMHPYAHICTHMHPWALICTHMHPYTFIILFCDMQSRRSYSKTSHYKISSFPLQLLRSLRNDGLRVFCSLLPFSRLPLTLPADREPLRATFFLKQIGYNVDRWLVTLRPHLFLHFSLPEIFLFSSAQRALSRFPSQPSPCYFLAQRVLSQFSHHHSSRQHILTAMSFLFIVDENLFSMFFHHLASPCDFQHPNTF